jgi:hypothetical protein
MNLLLFTTMANPDRLEELAAFTILKNARYPNAVLAMLALPLPNLLLRYLRQIQKFLDHEHLRLKGILGNLYNIRMYNFYTDFILSSDFLRNYSDEDSYLTYVTYIKSSFNLDTDTDSSSGYESYNSDSDSDSSSSSDSDSYSYKPYMKFNNFNVGTQFNIKKFSEYHSKFGPTIIVTTDRYNFNLPNRFLKLFDSNEKLETWNSHASKLKLQYKGIKNRVVFLSLSRK